MITLDKRADGRPEVRLADGHYPRQTLGSYRPDKSFSKRFKFGLRGAGARV